MMNEHYIYYYSDKNILRYSWQQKKAETWFSESEWDIYSNFKNKTRREEWLLGRFLAKQLILDNLSILSTLVDHPTHPSEIQVYSRNGMGKAVRPGIIMNGRWLNCSFSIAHSKYSILAAMAKKPGLSIGADIEFLCNPKYGFSATWLTPAEQKWIQEQGKPQLVSMLWAIKEAAYKAINTNQKFIPRQIEVRFYQPGGYRLFIAGKQLDREHRVDTVEFNNQVIAIACTRRVHPICRTITQSKLNDSLAPKCNESF